jgi:integrase
MRRRRREQPVKRVNPSGQTVWVARYTDPGGRRRSAGSYLRKREAQDAIDAAYDATIRAAPQTVGAYSETWTERHPRSPRTNATNSHRISRVLDVELEGMKLRDWPFRDLRRRHAVDLVDHMLRHQGRAHTGVQNILRSLSAMSEDAITDEIAEVNFVRGVRVRANDPRVRGATRPPRVFGFDELRRFAAHGGEHEPMLRVFTDCGLRLGEVLGLHRRDFDGEALHLRGSAHAGVFTPGDQPTKRHVRTVPCPPSTAELIRSMPARIDTPLLFPTRAGRIWHESNFRRDVWMPALAAHLGIVRAEGESRPSFEARRRAEIKASKRAIRPHDCRHSWITHLRAAGIDDADLAAVAGHTVETMIGTYTHPLGRSHDRIRRVIG